MDSFILLGTLLVLTVIIGAFMGIFAFAEVKTLRRELRRLREAVEASQTQSHPPQSEPSKPPQSDQPVDDRALGSAEVKAVNPSEGDKPPLAAKYAAPQVPRRRTDHQLRPSRAQQVRGAALASKPPLLSA